MNKYELGVIVRADLDEATFQQEMDRIKGLVDRFGGTIDKVDDWGRRRLSYPIQKLTEGMYTFITFTSPPDAPREIEGRLRIMENVLRFMTVCKDEGDTTASAQPQPEPTPVATAEPAPAEAEATEEPATQADTPATTEE